MAFYNSEGVEIRFGSQPLWIKEIHENAHMFLTRDRKGFLQLNIANFEKDPEGDHIKPAEKAVALDMDQVTDARYFLPKLLRLANTVSTQIFSFLENSNVIPLHSSCWSILIKDGNKCRTEFCFHLWCELTLPLWCHTIIWSLFA